MPIAASTVGSSLAYSTEVFASSSSSINNLDMSDRILVPEPEADVDAVIEQHNAVGQMGATADDEQSKENLRAKLRSTLSKKQSLPGAFLWQRPLLVIVLLAEGVDWLHFPRRWNSAKEEREVDGAERVDCNSPFVGSLSLHNSTNIHQLGRF